MSNPSPFIIEVDPYVGEDITTVASAACVFASRVGFDVGFDFNGVQLVVHPGSDAVGVVQQYFRLSQVQYKGKA